MSFRCKAWLVALVFSAINLGGAVFAFASREPIHTGVHAGLFVLGAQLVWQLAPGRDRGRVNAARTAPAASFTMPPND